MVNSSQSDPIHRILCPIDFSPTSEKAFAYATRIAQHSGATIVLLHAFDVPDSWSVGGRIDEVDQEIKNKLLAMKPDSADLKIERVAHGGPPGPVICWVAQEQKCDLIVIGTHGRLGVSHLLLGSVAEYCVRHAPCPVLTVRDRSDAESPLVEPEVYIPMPPVM
ncbi:MAG: universal stress protein [Planctomycetaceae bacterium]|nr:universal stress protein [Planctomycetaceae bacterium]